jgi:hypothetical protein
VQILKKITFLMALVLFSSAQVNSDQAGVVDVSVPFVVSAGSTQPCVVTVEGNGVAHIHSIPVGVVNSDVDVKSGVNIVSVPVSSGYIGAVTIYATMNGSNQVVGTTTVVLPN